MAIIQFKDVWEMYKIKFMIDGKISWENFWALKGVSFSVEQGETLGIIGENGAGKSSVLKIIAGMLKPNRGEIAVSGTVSGLLELGAGFQQELTGRENIYLIAALFGFTQSQIDQRYEEVVNFADIGKFINAPVKCYSQGMFVRLAFAMAIHVDPDILVIDDSLAVGDEYFQRKCIKKIFEIKEQGKTIILVTHDVHMLNRLCKRAIFLKEGKIVKDDSTGKVIPLYTQMSGARESIGVLEKNHFRLIFNNGRLFLNWKDKLITSNSGAYTAFLINDKWYNSLQADWEVKGGNPGKLEAVGKFYQLAMTQVWQLELSDNYEVKWSVKIESDEPIEIQEGCTNIILTSEYARWFTALESGDFSPIDDTSKKWQALLDGGFFHNCIGVEAKAGCENGIPVLVFENTQPYNRSQAQIFNTDYVANSRVLQYKTSGLRNYSENQADSFVYFSGKIAAGIPDTTCYLEKFRSEFMLTNDKAKLIFHNGQGLLFYNNLPVTKVNHINSAFYIDEKRYLSSSAYWQVKKEEEGKLIAVGRWPGIAVEQIWEITATAQAGFLLKVDLRVNGEVDIQEQVLDCMCQPEYSYWFSEYAQASFPGDFLETDIDITQRCLPESPIGMQSDDNGFPTLTFNFSGKSGNFVKVFNSSFLEKARIIRIFNVRPEKSCKFFPGTYPSFTTEVVLNEDIKVQPKKLVNTLEKGRLRFIFDNGSGRIFFDGVELTKRLGVYTSLRSGGRWYDSASSALWKIEGKTEEEIVVCGKWLRLPISQVWKARLIDQTLIELDIVMRVAGDIEVDRLQANIMLSEKYRKWSAKDERGDFSQFLGDINDDWEVVCSKLIGQEEGGNQAGVERESADHTILPAVIFLPQAMAPRWFLNVVNSDLYHRGRVLQCLKKEQEIIPAGEYHFYKGKIKVEG